MEHVIIVPPIIKVHMTGVTHADQAADGSVTLHYIDETTESVRLQRQITADENFFGLVSEVQEKSRRSRRPKREE